MDHGHIRCLLGVLGALNVNLSSQFKLPISFRITLNRNDSTLLELPHDKFKGTPIKLLVLDLLNWIVLRQLQQTIDDLCLQSLSRVGLELHSYKVVEVTSNVWTVIIFSSVVGFVKKVE